jgi:hypothetical protein
VSMTRQRRCREATLGAAWRCSIGLHGTTVDAVLAGPSSKAPSSPASTPGKRSSERYTFQLALRYGRPGAGLTRDTETRPDTRAKWRRCSSNPATSVPAWPGSLHRDRRQIPSCSVTNPPADAPGRTYRRVPCAKANNGDVRDDRPPNNSLAVYPDPGLAPSSPRPPEQTHPDTAGTLSALSPHSPPLPGNEAAVDDAPRPPSRPRGAPERRSGARGPRPRTSTIHPHRSQISATARRLCDFQGSSTAKHSQRHTKHWFAIQTRISAYLTAIARFGPPSVTPGPECCVSASSRLAWHGAECGINSGAVLIRFAGPRGLDIPPSAGRRCSMPVASRSGSSPSSRLAMIDECGCGGVVSRSVVARGDLGAQAGASRPVRPSGCDRR